MFCYNPELTLILRINFKKIWDNVPDVCGEVTVSASKFWARKLGQGHRLRKAISIWKSKNLMIWKKFENDTKL